MQQQGDKRMSPGTLFDPGGAGARHAPAQRPERPTRMVAEVSSEARTTFPSFPTGDTTYKTNYEGVKYNPRLHRAEIRPQWREDVAESARRAGIPTRMLAAAPLWYSRCGMSGEKPRVY